MSKFLLCSYSSSCEGTREVRAYDYADFHVLMLERMYQQRLKGYAELVYQTLSDDAESTPGIIYFGQKELHKRTASVLHIYIQPSAIFLRAKKYRFF